MVALALRKAATDPNLDEKARRAEIRATAKVLASLVPAERLLEAEERVRGAADAMSNPASEPATQAEPEQRDAASEPPRSLRVDS